MAVVAAHGLETPLGDTANREETVGACGMFRRAEKFVENCYWKPEGMDSSEEADDNIKTNREEKGLWSVN
jgi:hypothetical protein